MIRNKVYIIILNYNSYPDTIECLESIFKVSYDHFQVVVIDNDSTNQSLENIINWAKGEGHLAITTNFPDIVYPLVSKPVDFCVLNQDDKDNSDHKLTLIKAAKNNGFSAGNNIGLRYALQKEDMDFCWILNNDTIVEKDSLQQLVTHYKKTPSLGILGSKLLYYHHPKAIQAIGGTFNKWTYTSKHVGEGTPTETTKPELGKIDYVAGAAMFVSKKFITDIGLLNEDYFLYFEEMDWVLRGKKLNWTIDWCEESIVYHKEGQTIGSSSNYKKRSSLSEIEVFRSRRLFFKNFPKNKIAFWISSYLMIFNRLRRGQFGLANKFLKILHKKY